MLRLFILVFLIQATCAVSYADTVASGEPGARLPLTQESAETALDHLAGQPVTPAVLSENSAIYVYGAEALASGERKIPNRVPSRLPPEPAEEDERGNKGGERRVPNRVPSRLPEDGAQKGERNTGGERQIPNDIPSRLASGEDGKVEEPNTGGERRIPNRVPSRLPFYFRFGTDLQIAIEGDYPLSETYLVQLIHLLSVVPTAHLEGLKRIVIRPTESRTAADPQYALGTISITLGQEESFVPSELQKDLVRGVGLHVYERPKIKAEADRIGSEQGLLLPVVFATAFADAYQAWLMDSYAALQVAAWGVEARRGGVQELQRAIFVASLFAQPGAAKVLAFAPSAGPDRTRMDVRLDDAVFLGNTVLVVGRLEVHMRDGQAVGYLHRDGFGDRVERNRFYPINPPLTIPASTYKNLAITSLIIRR